MVIKFACKTIENIAKNLEQCLHRIRSAFRYHAAWVHQANTQEWLCRVDKLPCNPIPGDRELPQLLLLPLLGAEYGFTSFFPFLTFQNREQYLCVCYKGVIMLNPGWDWMSTPHLEKKVVLLLIAFHQFTCTTFSPLYWSALSYGSITPSSVLKGSGCCRFPSSSIGFSFFHFPSLSTLHSFNPPACQIFPVTPCTM